MSCSRRSSCGGSELGTTGALVMRFAKSKMTACICVSVNGRTCTSFTRLCRQPAPCKLLAEERVLAVMTTGMHNNSPFSSSAAALLRNITKCDRADCSQEGFCKVAAGNAAPACNGLHSANMYSWCACFENRLCRMARLQLDSTSFCLQFYCLTQTLEPQAHQMTNIQGVVLLCEAGCNATVGKHNAFRIPLLIACIPRL